MAKNLTNNIEMVIGSWGSYNECNSRAYGSKWLDLSEFETWEEIAQELKKEGFELDGLDEELFVQDIQNFNASLNWDYVNPENFFNLLKEADVLNDEYKSNLMDAVIEALGWEEFKNLVNEKGSNWDEDLYLYQDQTMLDVATDLFDECYAFEIPDFIKNYIDYEKFADDLSYDGYYETEKGILEYRR